LSIVIATETGIAAEVSKAVYVGARMENTLTGVFGQVFAAKDDVDDPLEPGTAVKLSFAERGAVLLPKG
jgi:iron(III) transport system ATP-binding protein